MAKDEADIISRDLVLNVIKEHKDGLTITDIADKVKKDIKSRETVARAIEQLEYENEIYSKKYGTVKIVYPNNRAVHSKLTREINIGEHKINRKIYIDVLDNEYGDFIRISEKKFVKNKWENKGSIIIPPAELSKFKKALDEIKTKYNEFEESS